MKLFGFALALLFSLSVFAAKPVTPLTPRLQELYNVLSKVPVNYKPDGIVCEQVVALQTREAFPADHYDITTGVEYEIGDGTLGELDLVVLNKETRKVELVGEVKCWHDFGAALDKASVQRDRFLWNLTQFPQKIVFKAHDARFNFTEANFHGLTQFIFISQMGGVKKGFNEEIPYNLGEMELLREKLVHCQNSGQCPL